MVFINEDSRPTTTRQSRELDERPMTTSRPATHTSIAPSSAPPGTARRHADQQNSLALYPQPLTARPALRRCDVQEPMPISVMQSMPRALLAARVFAEKATKSQKPQYMEPLGPPVGRTAASRHSQLTSYLSEVICTPRAAEEPSSVRADAAATIDNGNAKCWADREVDKWRSATAPPQQLALFGASPSNLRENAAERARTARENNRDPATSPGLTESPGLPPRSARIELAGRPMDSPTGSPKTSLSPTPRRLRSSEEHILPHQQRPCNTAPAQPVTSSPLKPNPPPRTTRPPINTPDKYASRSSPECNQTTANNPPPPQQPAQVMSFTLPPPVIPPVTAPAAAAAETVRREMEALETLAANPLFLALSRQQLSLLLQRGLRKAYPRYTTIVRGGAASGPVFVVMSGGVRCVPTEPPTLPEWHQKGQVIYPEEPQPTLGRGALFGEGILIGERTHPCDVVIATNHCELLRLYPEDLYDLPIDLDPVHVASAQSSRKNSRTGQHIAPTSWRRVERAERRAAAAAEVLTLDSTSPTRSGSPPLRPTTAADVTEHSEAIRHLKRRSAETTKFLMDVSNRRVLRPPHTVRGEVNAPVGMRPSNATMPNGEELLQRLTTASSSRARAQTAAPTFARVRPAPSEASAPL